MPTLPGGPLRRRVESRGWQPAARSPRGPKPYEHHFFGGRERGVPEPHAKFNGFLPPDKLAVAVGRATRAPQCPQGSLVSPGLPSVPISPPRLLPAGFSPELRLYSLKPGAKETMHKRSRGASEGKKLYLGRKFRCGTIFLSLPAQCYRVLRLCHAYRANIILMALFK